jgi:hypothetical protein
MQYIQASDLTEKPHKTSGIGHVYEIKCNQLFYHSSQILTRSRLLSICSKEVFSVVWATRCVALPRERERERERERGREGEREKGEISSSPTISVWHFFLSSPSFHFPTTTTTPKNLAQDVSQEETHLLYTIFPEKQLLMQ